MRRDSNVFELAMLLLLLMPLLLLLLLLLLILHSDILLPITLVSAVWEYGSATCEAPLRMLPRGSKQAARIS